MALHREDGAREPLDRCEVANQAWSADPPARNAHLTPTTLPPSWRSSWRHFLRRLSTDFNRSLPYARLFVAAFASA